MNLHGSQEGAPGGRLADAVDVGLLCVQASSCVLFWFRSPVQLLASLHYRQLTNKRLLLLHAVFLLLGGPQQRWDRR